MSNLVEIVMQCANQLVALQLHDNSIDIGLCAVGVQVGGTPAVMKLLLEHGYLDGDCLTCTGTGLSQIDCLGAMLNVHCENDDYALHPVIWHCLHASAFHEAENIACVT